MKLMIINHYAGSRTLGMEYRHFYLARELVRMGHEVTIVASGFSHLRGKNPSPKRRVQITVEEGVRFVWLKTPPYYRNNLTRVRNVASFLLALRLHARALAHRYRPDAVVASSTYLLDLYPARRIARLAGARLIFELHDVWPLSLTELYGISPASPVTRLLARAERASYRLSDAVVSILPGAARRAQELGITGKRITHVPNGTDEDAMTAEVDSPARRRILELKRRNIFTIVYVGGFAPANALETLLLAEPLLPPQTAVVLVGKGDLKRELMERAKHERLDNLYFEEYVSKEQTFGVMKSADCLYIGARASGLYRYGIGMNKLYDYMLAARPILFCINAPDNEVAASGCGICAAPEDAAALARAVEQLRDMGADQRDRLGRLGRDFVLMHRNYRLLATQFLDAVR